MTTTALERCPDKRWGGYYRAGAISVIIAGVLVLITLPLIPLLIPSLAPSSIQSGLTSIQSQSLFFGMTWGIYLVSDLLYLIAFPALYFALRQANRTVTLIAAIFNMVFVAVDVGVDIPLRFSLIGLSNSYVSTNGDSRAAFLATGQLTMNLANLTALVATFLQLSAIILASYAIEEPDVQEEHSLYRNGERCAGSLVHSNIQCWLNVIRAVQHRWLRISCNLEYPRRLQTLQAELISRRQLRLHRTLYLR